MPQNLAFDFALSPSGGPVSGFMLQRSQAFRGRAWKRSGVPVKAGSAFPEEERYESSQVPEEIAFVEVFDDFSGGFGYAYRRPPLPYRFIPVVAREMADPNVYHYAENYDARFQNQLVHAQAMHVIGTLPGGALPPVGVGQFGETDGIQMNPPPGAGAVFVLTANGDFPSVAGGGGYARMYTPTNGVTDASAFTVTVDPAIDLAGQHVVTGRPAFFGSYNYVPSASGYFLRFKRSGAILDSPAMQAQGFIAAGNRLWRYHGDPGFPIYASSLAAGADGASAGNWSATLPIGNGITPIQDAEQLAGQVFFGLSDGIYAGDTSGSFFNVIGGLAQGRSSENFRDLCVHDGQIIGQHQTGIYAYDPTNTAVARVRSIGPVARSNRSPVNGTPRTVTSFGGWLYAGLWTGSVSYLLAGRDTKGAGPYEWHVMQRLPHVAKISRIHFDGITSTSGSNPVPNRMWIATDPSINYGGLSGTCPVYWLPVPRLGGNPLMQDPIWSANYNGSAQMYLPSTDRGAPAVQKVYETAEVWLDAAASGYRYLNLYYSIDRGPRTLAGVAATSPVTVIPLGSANGYFPAGKSIEWSWDSFTTTPGSCHVLRGLVSRGKMRPRVVDTIQAVARIADDMVNRQNAPMPPAAVQIDTLRSFVDPARLGGVPIQLIDLAGATQWVCLIPPITETEVYEQGAQNPEIAATVQMVVMNLSAA